MNAPSKLEQSLCEMAERYDLLSVTLSLHRSPERGGRMWFHVGVQWADETQDHGRGMSAAHDASIGAALQSAMTEMLLKRSPLADAPVEFSA